MASSLQLLSVITVYTFVGSIITCSFIKGTTTGSYHGHGEEESESHRVINLPGQPSNPSVSHFSGYITVNEHHGRALFYWFFEAQSQPSDKPLLLWFNGGPGCSSIGYGAAVELGPLRVSKNGAGLEFNKHAWNKEANLLFVESPVGVGFSYTNTSSDHTKIDDSFVEPERFRERREAEKKMNNDAYYFLVNWMKKFPQYKSRDVYISGESYAGHYVPQLAELVYDRNKIKTTKYPHINLKGFIVGNPETKDYYDYKGLLEYAWSHAVISDQEFGKAKKVCNFKVSDWGEECNDAMGVVFDKYSEIDIYNIYAPTCLLNSTSSSSKGKSSGLGRMRILGGYDPCYSPYTEKYLNREDVQTSLHANTRAGVDQHHVNWKVCNDSLFHAYHYTVTSVLPIYTKLIKGGLKIWIYSGDADGRVPVLGSRYCIEALGLPVKSPWRSWYHNKQVGGRIVEYEGLTFVTVRGAGHLVPLNKPSEALSVIRSFLSGEHLPIHR